MSLVEIPKDPNGPPIFQPSGGAPAFVPLYWHHIEPDPANIGPQALYVAKVGAWDSLPDSATKARFLRAFVIMSLQAATLRPEPTPQPLGYFSPSLYADDEHNAAGSAVARTLVLLAPPGTGITSSVQTTAGGPPLIAGAPGAGLAPLAIVAIVAICAAAATIIGVKAADVVDSTNFRNNKTQQLVSTQAKALEVLQKHAEREKLAGKPLDFTDDERDLLGLLENTQRQIVEEKHQPLPPPWEGSKTLEALGNAGRGLLSGLGSSLGALLPFIAIGGALYLLWESDSVRSMLMRRRAPVLPQRAAAVETNEPITLVEKDGVYVVGS
jgi:hypothetical protein